MLETEIPSIRLTPSGVTALRQCGFRQVWLNERPERRLPIIRTPASARGKSVHAALAVFHRNGGAATYDLAGLRAVLARRWVREGYPDPEEERVARLRSEEEMVAYYERFGAATGTLVTERTWSFYRDLAGIRTEWLGRLDWLRVHEDGGLEVVDWKTSCQVTSADALAADPVTVIQARLARSLAQRHTGWPILPITVSQIFLGTLETIRVQVTREMVEAAEVELAALARGLRESALAPEEGPWCGWNGGCPVHAAGACPLFPAPRVEGEW